MRKMRRLLRKVGQVFEGSFRLTRGDVVCYVLGKYNFGDILWFERR